VAVARFNHPSRAIGPRLRLEAEGIPTFLDGERMGVDAACGLSRNGVPLLVPEVELERARGLLGLEQPAPAARTRPAAPLGTVALVAVLLVILAATLLRA
jgi:hypothetical protein